MQTVYIISPSNVATGGTELLQQLCYVLREIGVQSLMYYTEEYSGSLVQKKFQEYENPYIDYIPDDKGSIIVIPETRIDISFNYKKAIKYYWWLSVDNYYGAFKINRGILRNMLYWLKDNRNSIEFKKNMHLVQSQYAFDFLTKKKHIDPRRVLFLSDYLNKTYIQNAAKVVNANKKNRILYNPLKGYEFTRKIQENCTEYEWVALQNLTNSEMFDLLSSSKVYIDFGNHPGKDRIPREGALCGCCIITGQCGAAKNHIDIPIPNKYKFDDKIENIPQIHLLIKECMDNYEELTNDFKQYRDKISSEENGFKKNVIEIFGSCIAENDK